MSALPTTSRFTLLERPLRNPGKCVVCGAVDRPVVDLGLDLPHFGTVYFCVSCLAEAAVNIGMVPEETVVSLRLSAEHSTSEYLAANSLRTITDEQYDYLTNTLSILSSVFPNPSVSGVDTTDEDGGEEEPRDIPVIPADSKPADKKSRSHGGSTSKPGPVSVPADNGDGSGPVFNL